METLRLPWGGDDESAPREVAPSVFRPRKARSKSRSLRSHASRPSPRPPQERARTASVSRTSVSRTSVSRTSAGVVDTAPPRGSTRGAGHASREVARDRVPGRVVQGPQRERHEPDYLLMVAAVALTAMGILMVYSSSGVAAARGGSIFDAVTTQLTWAIVGAVALLVVMRLDYRYWRLISVLGFAIAVGLLVLLLLPSIPPLIVPEFKNGATRWLRLGGLPSFQPAEFAKLALIVYLAHWLTTRGADVGSFRRGMLPFLIILGAISGLVLLEPDLGTTGILVLTAFTMFFVAGGSLWQLVLLVPVVLAGVAGMLIMRPYQLARVTTFLDPFGVASGEGYQTVHGLMALGLGGIFGQGLGESRQPSGLALPAAENDFIFAVVGQEFGLIGGLAVIGLFLLLAWRGIRVAMHAPDTFGGLLAMGITAWLAFQAFINIAVVVNLMPLTGMPLPFLSDGGSSLVVSLAAVGILLSISRESVPRGVSADEDPDRSRGHRRPHLPRLGRRFSTGGPAT